MAERLDRKGVRFALAHLHPGIESLAIIRPDNARDRFGATQSFEGPIDHGHVELVVGRVPITRELVELIPEVRSLRIQNAYIDRDAVGALASRLGKIERLHLEHAGVFDDGAHTIASGLTDGLLRELRMPLNKLSLNGLRAMLKSQPQLETLDISHNRFTSAQVAALLRKLPAATPNLNHLAMNDMVMAPGVNELRELPELYEIDLPLRSLELRQNELKKKHLDRIQTAYPQVEELDVRGNSINSEGVTSLLQASDGGVAAQLDGNPGLLSWRSRLGSTVVAAAAIAIAFFFFVGAPVWLTFPGTIVVTFVGDSILAPLLRRDEARTKRLAAESVPELREQAD